MSSTMSPPLTAETNHPSAPATEDMITFSASGQDFCLPVGAIRELRAWSQPTPLPLADPALIGVINLRGTILPVLDLAVLLALEAVSPPPLRPVIMVIESGRRRAGLILDRVRDIVQLPLSAIEPATVIGDSASCLAGFAMMDGAPLRILDAARLLSARLRI